MTIPMLTKFDSKSSRVKGLSFHPKRPWILASLHNGVIQLWDYRMGTLLDRFEEHGGPIRGIDFHKTQPLFVSGGDDYKIKVWNYQQRRCMFTLVGHLDYIRTVQFHHEYPWIVSASDDQTIRIWNWQSRTCIAVLTGHNHYVMCAQFHPTKDLIVSASLDQTVRVWDTSGLRSKTVKGAPSSRADGLALTGRGNTDIFGATDAVVKFVLEGHERGVNWATFHPTDPVLIASGSDDRSIRLWRMGFEKAWCSDTLYGATHNVSCVAFHPNYNLLIANGEDRYIRIYDIETRTLLHTFRRESDRFWILNIHPTQNLIAAGHDSGMVVFKIQRERPPFAVSGGQVYYVHSNYIRSAILGTTKTVPRLPLRVGAKPTQDGTRSLSINHFAAGDEHVLLFNSNQGGQFELYNLAEGNQRLAQGSAISAVFTSRTKITVLDKERQLSVRSFAAGDPGKRVKPPYPHVDSIFASGTPGRILVRSEDRLCLFELQSRRIISEITGISARYVIWNSDFTLCAILSKHSVVLADRDLTQICSVAETVRVKSGCFDTSGVFVYTTLSHLKYLLPIESGENGILQTLDSILYAVEARNGSLFLMSREAKLHTLPLDLTEPSLRYNLREGNHSRILAIIKSAKLHGSAVIGYLREAGFPELALLFVDDVKTRFELAVSSLNLDIATDCARKLNTPYAWRVLAAAATESGDVQLLETCLQAARDLPALSMLYSSTGQLEKLRKLQIIFSTAPPSNSASTSSSTAPTGAGSQYDPRSRFATALLLGDVQDRVRSLESSGQLALALLTAQSHGLHEEEARLADLMRQAGLQLPNAVPRGRGLHPAVPSSPITGALEIPGRPLPKSKLDLRAIGAAAAKIISDGSALDGGLPDRASIAAAAISQAFTNEDEFDASFPSAAAPAAPQDAAVTAGSAKSATAGAGAFPFDSESTGVGSGGFTDFDALDTGDVKEDGGGGWGVDDIDLGLDDGSELQAAPEESLDIGFEEGAGAGIGSGAQFEAPKRGAPVPTQWAQQATLPCDLLAAGATEPALKLLNRQVGARNMSVLRSHALSTVLASRCSLAVPAQGLLPAVPAFVRRSLHSHVYQGPQSGEKVLPMAAFTAALLSQRLARAQQCFSEGRFQECLDLCDGLLLSLALAPAVGSSEVEQLTSFKESAREYKIAVRLILASKQTDPADGGRQIELSALATHCELSAAHAILTLNMAMRLAFKFQQYILAARLAKRLIDLPEAADPQHAKTLTDAKKVLAASEQRGRNMGEQVSKYDPTTQVFICAKTLSQIQKGEKVLNAAFSGAHYREEFKGETCVIDNFSQIGLETVGFVCEAR